MNRRVFTPILLAVLSIMAILPAAPSFLAHGVTPANLAVSPASSAGDVGSTIPLAVTIDGVSSLVGYDVVLTYDPAVLSFVSANFVGAPNIFAGKNPFVVAQGCSDATGACESAQTLLGGASVTVSSPTQVFSVNFKVLQSTVSTVSITKADLAALSGGVIVSVPANISNGVISAPPVLSFSAPASTNPRVVVLTQIQDGSQTPPVIIHITTVTISGFILMTSANVRAGFGAVQFDVIDPAGASHSVQSNIAFLFPGQSATVTATFSFESVHSSSLGTYHIIATVLRCPDPASCINGPTQSGLFFLVKEG